MAVPEATAAIDFGGTVTDVVLRRPGAADVLAAYPGAAQASADVAESLLRKTAERAGLEALPALGLVAVTGGRSGGFPDRLLDAPVARVDETTATASGGLADDTPLPALVVSMGTGTGLVLANPPADPQRLVGCGLGGGTLLGLSQLILGTTDVRELGKIASGGDPGRCDLTVADIVGGGIGPVPGTATASHFARMGRTGSGRPSDPDLLAGLFNLVGQPVLRLAFECAMAHGAASVVLIGHLLDVPGFLPSIEKIPGVASEYVRVPADPGFAVARGALAAATAT